MQISSAKKTITNLSAPYRFITTLQSTENSSPPPPNYNLINNSPNNHAPRHSQLPSLSSPPHTHNSISPEDTKFDNSSNIFPINKVCQSTKITLLLDHL